MKQQINEKGRLTTGTIISRVLISLLIILLLDFLAGLVIIPENYQSFRTSHPYYHHGLLSNRDKLAAWGSLIYPVHTNSLGFMDSVVRRVPVEGPKERLLILGDSHAEGVGVPYLKTFSGRLARLLSSRNIEVLNGSCISYSPKIEYLKLRYLIEQKGFIPDHLFVLIDISDLQNELVYEGFNPDEKISSFRSLKLRTATFFKSNFSIWYLVNAIQQAKQQQAFMENAELFDAHRSESGNNNTIGLYAQFFSHFNDNTLLSNPQFHGVGEWYYDEEFRQLADQGIASGQSYIFKIKELCDLHQIRLTISVHPWHSQIYKGEAEDYYVRRWSDFAAAHEISFLNLFPLFVNEQNPAVVVETYYIKEDNHWNEFGHEIVADRLYRYFVDGLNKTERP